jgi:hypothetical protein
MDIDTAAARLRADLDHTDRRLTVAKALLASERADLDPLDKIERAVLAYHEARKRDFTLRAAIVCAIAETTEARLALRMMSRRRWLGVVAVVVLGRC